MKKNGWKQLDINFSSSHQQIGMKLRSTQPENRLKLLFHNLLRVINLKNQNPLNLNSQN